MAKKAPISLREAVQRVLKTGQTTAEPNSARLGLGSSSFLIGVGIIILTVWPRKCGVKNLKNQEKKLLSWFLVTAPLILV